MGRTDVGRFLACVHARLSSGVFLFNLCFISRLSMLLYVAHARLPPLGCPSPPPVCVCVCGCVVICAWAFVCVSVCVCYSVVYATAWILYPASRSVMVCFRLLRREWDAYVVAFCERVRARLSGTAREKR